MSNSCCEEDQACCSPPSKWTNKLAVVVWRWWLDINQNNDGFWAEVAMVLFITVIFHWLWGEWSWKFFSHDGQGVICWKERVSGCMVFQSPIIIICYHPLGSDLSVNPSFLGFAAFKVRVPEDFCNYFFQYYCCPFCLICTWL